MPELLIPRPKLSSAIREFASKAQLPKSVSRRAAAVFFKTEEFERRLDSLRAEMAELAELHEEEVALLVSINAPTLDRMKKEHARREGRVKSTHGLLSKMEDSYNGAHKSMNDMILDEVVTQDRFIEAKGEMMLSMPEEFRAEAVSEAKKDDASIGEDYSAKFGTLLDGWKKEFTELDRKYADLRSEYPPEAPIEVAEAPAQPKPELPKPIASEQAQPAQKPEAAPAPQPKAEEATPPAPAQKRYRTDIEQTARRIMLSYSLHESEFDMLCGIISRLAGEKDASSEYMRIQALYETTRSILSSFKEDSQESLNAVSANLAGKWESSEGEWRAKSLTMITLLSDCEPEDKPALLALLKDPDVAPSSIGYWFELHYGGMTPQEREAAIAEDKQKHPGASKMIDSFHSIFSGFNAAKDRILAAKIELPRDRELVLVFEVEKVENELGGNDYYLLPTPSSAVQVARFEGPEFEQLISTPAMQGYGHSHTSKDAPDFISKDLEALIRCPSIAHLLLNAETGGAQFYNPRDGKIGKIECVEL